MTSAAMADTPPRTGLMTTRTSLAVAVLASFVYLFLIMPSLIVIPMSFGDSTEFQFPPRTISLQLYETFFFDSDWMAATIRSLQVASMTTCMAVAFGLTASYGIVRGRIPGRQILTVFLLSPMLVPLIVIALGLYIYFTLLGIGGTMLALVLAHTLYATPFAIVLLSAAMRQIDPNLESAAMLMGASRTYVLRRVTLPLLKPALIASALFVFLTSFDEVIMAIFLSGPRTRTLPVRMYESITWEISPVLAAVSSLMTLVALLGCVAVLLTRKPTVEVE